MNEPCHTYEVVIHVQWQTSDLKSPVSQHTATTQCNNTLQHTATHCNTLQRTATHCNTLQYILMQWAKRNTYNVNISLSHTHSLFLSHSLTLSHFSLFLSLSLSLLLAITSLINGSRTLHVKYTRTLHMNEICVTNTTCQIHTNSTYEWNLGHEHSMSNTHELYIWMQSVSRTLHVKYTRTPYMNAICVTNTPCQIHTNSTYECNLCHEHYMSNRHEPYIWMKSVSRTLHVKYTRTPHMNEICVTNTSCQIHTNSTYECNLCHEHCMSNTHELYIWMQSVTRTLHVKYTRTLHMNAICVTNTTCQIHTNSTYECNLCHEHSMSNRHELYIWMHPLSPLC